MRRPLLFAPACICFVSLATIVLLGDAPAAADGPTVAPANKDADYPIIGEFVGPIEIAPRQYKPLAVQIRSMGGGSFEAAQYLGGLPGEKGHKKELKSLLGRRSGDFLVLSGGPWALLVHHDHVVVVNETGDRIGRLEKVVRESPTIGAKPPKNAIVIFDGQNTEHFTTAKMTEDGLLMQGADFKPMFQDYNIHLEFLLPYKPGGRDQNRGNSGVYLQSRYEVQILDSFAEPPTPNGLGSLYRYREPDVNMGLPPSTWQTYDIQFTAPRWAASAEKIRNAQITVWLNGVKIHDNVKLENKTGAGKPEEPTLLPIRLQDHGSPVRYRNIWVIDRGLSPAANFPIYPPKPQQDQDESAPEKKSVAPKEEAAHPEDSRSSEAKEKQPAPPKEEKSAAKRAKDVKPDQSNASKDQPVTPDAGEKKAEKPKEEQKAEKKQAEAPKSPPSEQASEQATEAGKKPEAGKESKPAENKPSDK